MKYGSKFIPPPKMNVAYEFEWLPGGQFELTAERHNGIIFSLTSVEIHLAFFTQPRASSKLSMEVDGKTFRLGFDPGSPRMDWNR